ncbi:MAG TPA: hypothetical protein VOA41_06285 [Candidatus Dormibacteraeota bacterium]|nr:hypothetical protein [Candidatus Dormibacteraeota bacterium]
MSRNRLVAFVIACLLSPASAYAQAIISTVAGGGPDRMPATAANLGTPRGVAIDPAGNYFIAASNRVFRVDTTGLLTIFAGNGLSSSLGDGGQATAAGLAVPSSVALDSSGTIFFADIFNHRIRRVDVATGIITTVAGNGGNDFSGDGGAATSASLNYPRSVAVDASNNLYIADTTNSRIRRVDAATGIITTVAGNGTPDFSGDGVPATAASLNYPTGVVVDTARNLYIADFRNHRIRRVDAATGIITTVAGNGAQSFSGDGGPATSASLNGPQGVAVDGSGNLYIADTDNYRIRRVDMATRIITTVAGGGIDGDRCGDGGPATDAKLYLPTVVGLDTSGNLSIADTDANRICRVEATTGIITAVAGNGTPGFSGDGGPATNASLSLAIPSLVSGVALNASGNLFIADPGNHRVRRLDAATGIITTVAGNGEGSFSGDGGPATGAGLAGPSGVSVDASGNLFIADSFDHRIRRVDAATGVITTVAGNGTPGFSGDGGAATAASFYEPSGVAVDASGNLYIADIYNSRIRRVDAATGIITTVAGNGFFFFSGDGGPATSASLDRPRGVAVDGSGNLYIADTNNYRIRRVDAATGIITTVAGGGTGGDGGPATSASIAAAGVAVDSSGNLFISGDNIRRVDAATGIITTVAGSGTYGFSGDGGPATSASLSGNTSVALDASGNKLYIGDLANFRIRLVQ